MTSFAIIPHEGQKVNPQYQKVTEFAGFRPAQISANPVTPQTAQVAVKHCSNYNPDPYATNAWTTLHMSFQWHGDDVASFDDQIHTLIERNATTKEATFRPVDQPAARVIMCADLLDSIIQRTTYDLTTHNGEISFVNGKVHTFRAYTQEDGERVIQEKRGKNSFQLFGTISPDGTVTPIIPSHLSSLAADDDPRYADEAKNARRKIRIIQAKANLINDPTEMMTQNVAVSFKGSCRCCNRTLKKPKSVANGIGPTCAKKKSRAAVARPTASAMTDYYDHHSLTASGALEEETASHVTVSSHDWSHPELQDFDLDSSLPLTACQVLFCTSELGAMGCSNAEIERFFDDLLPGSPYWYPNFTSEAAAHEKSFDFLHDLCDAFVYSITPLDDYVRIAGQLFHYKRDALGYEFVSLVGSQENEMVELVVYPHEVQLVKQELVWAG